MARLVTIEQAQAHLRLNVEGSPPVTDDHADLEFKIAQATEIVIDYIKRPDHGWDLDASPPVEAPALVQAAVLLVLSALYEDREGTGDGDYLRPDGAVVRILHRYRDPAIA